jgi:hypothetical protein
LHDFVVCYKWLAGQVLLKGSKDMKITGRETGTVGLEVHTHPSVALQLVTNPVESVGSINIRRFGPLKRHLTSKRFAADADVKCSPPDTEFVFSGMQVLVSRWDGCLQTCNSKQIKKCIHLHVHTHTHTHSRT